MQSMSFVEVLLEPKTTTLQILGSSFSRAGDINDDASSGTTGAAGESSMVPPSETGIHTQDTAI